MKTQITTGKVRFSYCSLITPRAASEDAQAKYSVTLLVPKTAKGTLRRIKEAQEAAKQNYLEKNSGKKLPRDLKTIVHDGDGERVNGGDFGPECAGCYVLTVSSANKPVMVDEDKNPIDPEEIYSGCYGKAIINFYVYDRNGNKGISAGLNGIMKTDEGEPLAGGVVTDDDWDEAWDDDDDDDDDDMLD